MQRLQKFLASHGFGSRREIDQWIGEGRITVNGKVAEPGLQVHGREDIAIDGKSLRIERREQKPRVLMYHKPTLQVCTLKDPEGRDTVFRHLPSIRNGRWISVGRLDFNTSGLLLLTDDGELANRLMHPSSEVEREYAVRVRGKLAAEQMQALRDGVELEDGPAKFDNILDGGGTDSNHWYHVTLREGRNREVRRMIESQQGVVSRLQRVRYGNVNLPRYLKPGKWKFLSDDHIKKMYLSVGLEYPEIKQQRGAGRNVKKIYGGKTQSR